MNKQETINYLETATGDIMRVPESRLNEFLKLDRRPIEDMQQKQNSK